MVAETDARALTIRSPRIYEVMRRETVRAGDVVINQGERGEEFYVLDAGELAVSIAHDGKAVEIMRKPKEAVTAEDLKHIEKRIVRRESPSSSSTGLLLEKGIRSKTTLTRACRKPPLLL